MKQVLSALLVFTTLTVAAQKKWSTIKGNGKVQTETRQVGSFTAIDDRGSIDVDITYGNSIDVSVEADENLLPYIITQVERSKLQIMTKDYGISSSKRIRVHITMPTITALTLSGSGNMVAKGTFENSGSTKLDIRGSGSIQFGFASVSSLSAEVHGSGNIDLQGGQVNTMDAAVYGSGNINAYAVNSKYVKAKTSGSGNVKVTASESLEAVSNGSGNVYYKGEVTNINIKSNGSGKVMKGR